MKSYKISEIAALSGTTVKSLRYYEEKGLLCPVRGAESNYRLYEERDISKIKNIKLLQSLGFSIKEICMIHGARKLENENLKQMLTNQIKQTQFDIEDLEERRVVLTNILEKLNDGNLNSSHLLTLKEKDIFMGITTGFSKLDQLLKSHSYDQLIVLAARPGMGKTALAIHIAYNLLEQTQKEISFFSTEINEREWIERIAAQKCEFDVRTDELDKEEQLRFINTCKEIENQSINYKYSKRMSIDDITEQCLKSKNKQAAIVIDYFQDIEGESHKKIKNLKNLSKKLNCPVIILCTVSKSAELREDAVPWLEDLNDYSLIKDSVDKILTVSRLSNMKLSQTKSIANIEVFSKGSTRSKNVNLVWDGSYCGYNDKL